MAKKKTEAENQRAVTARVTVYPRPDVLDPEGEAIRAGLARIGYQQVVAVRAGRSFEIALAGVDGESAADLLRAMCEELLANEVLEDYSWELLDGDGGKP